MQPCRQVWERLSEAENRHDLSGHPELLTHNVVVHVPGGVELDGADSYVGMITAMFRGLPDYCAQALHVAEVDDVVIVHWSISGTHDGDLFGISPTGRRVTYRGCSVWRAESGRIAEGWLYPDRASMLAQLGAE